MDMHEIIEKTNEFLVEEFEVEGDKISSDAHFHETLDLDSLDYVDLVVAIESISDVKLGKEDFNEVVTFRDFYNVLERKIKEKV